MRRLRFLRGVLAPEFAQSIRRVVGVGLGEDDAREHSRAEVDVTGAVIDVSQRVPESNVTIGRVAQILAPRRA